MDNALGKNPSFDQRKGERRFFAHVLFALLFFIIKDSLFFFGAPFGFLFNVYEESDESGALVSPGCVVLCVVDNCICHPLVMPLRIQVSLRCFGFYRLWCGSMGDLSSKYSDE